MSKIPFFLRFAAFFIFSISSSSSADQRHHSRHLLHQPFFPIVTAAPPPYQPPSSSEPPSPSPHGHHHHKKHPLTPPPPPHEKHLFSSVTNPPPPPPSPPSPNPFFPSSDPSSTANHPPPPPHPPHPATLPTFPANISSLLFPTHNNLSKPHHSHLITITASVVASVTLLCLFAVLIIFLRQNRHRRRSSPADDTKSIRSDSHHLFNAAPSDGSLKQKHQQPPKYASSNTSSEFLYLGTLVNSRSGGLDQQKSPITVSGNITGVLELPAPPASSSSSSSYAQYQKLGSPELRPLPPLPKLPTFTPTYRSTEQLNPKRQDFDGDDNENENDEFFSPRGSSGRKQSPTRVWSSIVKDIEGISVDQIGRRSFDGSNSCSPTNSVSPTKASPGTSLKPKSHSPPLNNGISKRLCPSRPPPPPPPPPQFRENPATVSFSLPGVDSGNENEKLKENKEETLKPKLKTLHWDKVRASSSHAMVWDQIKSNSFQVNEEMMETLFRVNDPSSKTKDSTSAGVVQSVNHGNRFLDPRKSHNIAILLRALNVTADEVCEALIEGNSDTLGPELLECLLKMAPTKEEEEKLKELNEDDNESPSKIGPAEKFLKALLDIPFAFKRIDAMLYIVNFESETEYLKRSFDTLEAACGELKNTRMFLKLLEAVLKTGNRMNIGTNRGDAHAFKLDTLLKLVDIKGADGKTTLLHFVVQEIIKSEGARVSSTPTQSPIGNNRAEQSAFQDDLELKKLGLQVVSGLSSQLINVKKAAAMDSKSLNDETEEIAKGITKVKEVIAELKQERFLDSMNSFLSKAEKEITEIQSHGSNVMKMVKEVTEYFHGNSESHPSRIFAVVRDFLTILDQVCKEVGRVNERTVYGSVPRPSISNQTVTPPFPVVNNNNSRLSHSGSDEEEAF